MPRSTASPRRAGRPPVTSRAQILAAARTLIDRDGWETLSIRRLAAELGVGATTLYHHVRDREDILVQLLNDLAARTPHPELPDDPRGRIIAAGAVGHEMFADAPWAAEVATTDGFLGQIDESAAWMAETIVGAALEAGCTREQAVIIFRSLWFYTVGELLVRTHSARKPIELDRIPGGAFFRGADMAKLPHLAAIGNDWVEIESRDTFHQSLEAFVDGLLAQARSANAEPPPEDD